ncbi:MAG: hypothetical protein JO279_14525 [Verrucomicrobia bacterium]|nr:hypothetical protein [Verrucomicrobiota bacterium]
MRKSSAVLRDCFGLRLSPGGLSQALKAIRKANFVPRQGEGFFCEVDTAPSLCNFSEHQLIGRCWSNNANTKVARII